MCLLWFELFQLALQVKSVCRGGIGTIAVSKTQFLPLGLTYQSDCLGFFVQYILENFMMVVLVNMMECGRSKSQEGRTVSYVLVI